MEISGKNLFKEGTLKLLSDPKSSLFPKNSLTRNENDDGEKENTVKP